MTSHLKYGGYSKYDDLIKAVETGTGLKKYIDEQIKWGTKKDDIAAAITKAFNPKYIAANTAERARMKGRLLNAYVLLGYKREDRNKAIDKWLMKK